MNPPSNAPMLLRYGLLTYIVLTASACYVLILKGLDSAPPFAFAGLRTLWGGVAILAFTSLTGRRILPEKRLWKWIPLVATTATTLTFGSMFLSPKFAGAGLASILGNAQPVFIALIGCLLLGERLSRMQFGSLAIGFIGVAVIVAPSFFSARGGSITLGAILALTTSLSAALGSVLARFIRPGDSLLPFTGWQLAAGGVLLLGISRATGEPAINWNGSFVWILLVLGVFNSAIVTWAWFFLLQKEEAGKLSIYLYLTPLLGVLWAVVFAGERPAASSLTGGALVVLSVFAQEFEGFARRMRLRS